MKTRSQAHSKLRTKLRSLNKSFVHCWDIQTLTTCKMHSSSCQHARPIHQSAIFLFSVEPENDGRTRENGSMSLRHRPSWSQAQAVHTHTHTHTQTHTQVLCCYLGLWRSGPVTKWACDKLGRAPVSTHIWDPTGGHMGKIMGPLWATQRGPTWGMIMGFHWDPSGISLGTHMGPRSFPSKSHTNSHMGPNWVCPCISHIYIYICVLFINLFCWCCFCLLFDVLFFPCISWFSRWSVL